MRRLLFGAVLALFWLDAAHAQVIGRAEEIANTTRGYFVHARPGEATIRVHVMGTVPSPGTYEIATESSVLEVLAFSGGMGQVVEQNNQRRYITLRVWRMVDGSQQLLYEGEYPALLEEAFSLPTLQENDVMEVRTRVVNLFNWRDGLSISTTILTMLNLIVQIRRFNR